MAWYVYMLLCGDGTLYTGMTDDVPRRLRAHQSGRGAKYTRGRGPLTLVYTQEQPSRSAALGNQYAQFFWEQRNNFRPPSVMLAVTQLLYHMSRIFQDNSVPPDVPMGQQVDRKLRRKIQEKKIAMGHKPDDHEEQWPEMTM